MTKLLLVAALIFLGYLYLKGKAQRPGMPRDDAARLLGVAPDADAATVNAAHRRLIARVHPDAGGNAELAAQINRARDALLRGVRG